MPWDRSLYPDDWGQISLTLRAQAQWRCEQCGRPCVKPGESHDEFIERAIGTSWESELFEDALDDEKGVVPLFKRGRFTLTVAHQNHIPSDCSPENLKVWCNPCHGRNDLAQMRTKRRLKQERLGQLTLPL